MLRFLVVTTAFIFAAMGAVAHAKDRVALVIGNGGYQQFAHLPNAASDAELIEKSLTKVGFKTFFLKDGTRQQMADSLKLFIAAVNNQSSVVVYYAGHGIQYDDENYLIPVDSKLSSPSDLPLETFGLGMVTQALERAHPKISVIVLDACRNNPLRGQKNISLADAAVPGLAKITGPLGTFIAFATAPGQVATDGAKGNSPFTSALSEVMMAPGLPIEQVFKRVRERVIDETAGAQVPWDNSSLTSEFFFTNAVAGIPKFNAQAAEDAQSWQAAADVDTVEAYETYLRGFPNGLFTDLAQMRIGSLNEAKNKGSGGQTETEVSGLASDRKINAADDLSSWNAIPEKGRPEQYRDYLTRFPSGVFSKLARLRLEDASQGNLNQIQGITTKIRPNYEEFADTPLYPEITECDREAGHVQEIADPSVGVYFKQVVPGKAIPACLTALKQYPDSLRILMNYGRAIDAAGRHDEAREIYRTGADAGFPIAYRSLGDVYRDGRGLEKNLNEARYWYVLGAAKKNVFAEYNLALIYESGLGVEKNPLKAAYWLWRGAKQGFAPAMESLSKYYLDGTVLAKDPAQAELLLQGASEMGHIYAELRLGDLYIDGNELRKDPLAGARWISQAARQGYNEAQYRLASLYADGIGVSKDPAAALNWYTLAKSTGLVKANAPAGALAKKLGKKAAREADQFVKDFRSVAIK
ncbi:caspase family protein [Rhizobium laguerreae]|uniref:caspase family protein n=1 Tax=Rhizobium laguerreae TaxID=1076926 RepID=UPI001C91E9F1|nr:caspase family protein [Rhizobium laguerreae]MBY3348007.1 hypothetical protein [Rhizobium laguerreae]MBY3354970.1 hypothetical protein [Rhizobium laguerreae]MBY3376275.1 hypothetical protein [Rhizobium laguerreae]MBY3431274.1 hypothetical protein [Rhizobium laguerreae]MBY3439889.1 hypothetical protein [Rhizobium laguerreae]